MTLPKAYLRPKRPEMRPERVAYLLLRRTPKRKRKWKQLKLIKENNSSLLCFAHALFAWQSECYTSSTLTLVTVLSSVHFELLDWIAEVKVKAKAP